MKKTVHSKFLFLLISFMILALFASCAHRAAIKETSARESSAVITDDEVSNPAIISVGQERTFLRRKRQCPS